MFLFTFMLFGANTVQLELDPEKENILVLHSWHDILWDRTWGKGIDNVLGSDYNLIRYDFDAMRQDETELKRRAEFSWKLAEKYNVVGIVFGDDQTLKYAGPLFQGTKYPGVYLGINFSPRKYLDYSKADNITGVLERPLYKTAIKKLFKIFPETPKKVLLLSDSPLGEEDITDMAKLFKQSETIKIFNTTLEYQVQDTWEKWQKAVLDAPKNGFDYIMVGSRYILRDKNGLYIEPEAHLLDWMTKNSMLPVFGFYEDGIGPEFDVGGWVLGGVEHGETAGKIMYDILKNGKKPSDINPVFYNYGQYIFSRTLLKKYNLTLPKAILEQTQFIEDRHSLWDFKKQSFDKGDVAWTPSSLYRSEKHE
ncbi:MAG: hypothetical protein DRG24_01975 [Epsilonproteobacteria bacterium]|nr:MAG: hypothetical protein DRG24_01975 [Campylobacterota bacterium]